MNRPDNIFIVRHGQSEGNVNDKIYQTKADYALNLTPLGEQQAVEAGKVLKARIGEEELCFYTSPYFRAKQTLFNIKKSFDPKKIQWIYEDPRLREQEWGNYQPDTTVKDYEAERDVFGRFFYRFRDGESGGDVFDRCSGFLDTFYRDLDKPNFPNNAVIVAHGYTNRVLVMRWLHIAFQEFETWGNPKNCAIIQLQRKPNGKYRLIGEMEKGNSPSYEYRDEPNA